MKTIINMSSVTDYSGDDPIIIYSNAVETVIRPHRDDCGRAYCELCDRCRCNCAVCDCNHRCDCRNRCCCDCYC